MTSLDLPDQIQWRIHLSSSPEKVFETLATAQGRAAFWAAEAPEYDGTIHFKYSAVDFSVDLRNNDPKRTWGDGFVDV